MIKTTKLIALITVLRRFKDGWEIVNGGNDREKHGNAGKSQVARW